jgi:hypothetical protein
MLFQEDFTSDDQTIAAAGLLTIAHGLSGEPRIIQLNLKNKVSEHGFVVGDVILADIGKADVGNGHSVAVWWDSTNIYVRLGTDPNAIFIGTHKETGAQVGLFNTNWYLVVKAWR